MRVISVRENPEYKEVAIKYFPSKWTEVAPEIYEDCITHAVGSEDVLPQGYLLEKEGIIMGFAPPISTFVSLLICIWYMRYTRNKNRMAVNVATSC